MVNNTGRKCLLDKMYIDLKNLDLFTGVLDTNVNLDTKTSDYFKLGNCVVKKEGSSILTKKCDLKLQVERNLESNICHNGIFEVVFFYSCIIILYCST